MNSKEKLYAHYAGLAAVDAERRNDAQARNAAMLELWGHAGYWGSVRAAPYMSICPPPKMIRFPDGRSERWDTHKLRAAKSWCKWSDVDG